MLWFVNRAVVITPYILHWKKKKEVIGWPVRPGCIRCTACNRRRNTDVSACKIHELERRGQGLHGCNVHSGPYYHHLLTRINLKKPSFVGTKRYPFRPSLVLQRAGARREICGYLALRSLRVIFGPPPAVPNHHSTIHYHVLVVSGCSRWYNRLCWWFHKNS